MSFSWTNSSVKWTNSEQTKPDGDSFQWESGSKATPGFSWGQTQPKPNEQEQASSKVGKNFYQTSSSPACVENEQKPIAEVIESMENSGANSETNAHTPNESSEQVFEFPDNQAGDQSYNETPDQVLETESVEYDFSPNFDAAQYQANQERDTFTKGLKYYAQSLPENAPELVAEKLETEFKKIEFTRSNITEGSPWSSDAFVRELDLPECLKNALYDLKVDRLSKIQKFVIPKLLEGRDVVAQSQSGTGKTITFLTAAFKHVNPELAKPQVLIVLPTLELALQVSDVSDHIGKNSPEVRIRMALRGERFQSEATEHIIIGTPGKLLELILRLRKIDCSNIKMVIFDEADNLFDAHQNRELMLLIKNALPESVQVVMFSATFTDEFCDFINSFSPDAEILRLQQYEVALDNIRQLYVKVHNEHEKLSILIRILRLADCGSCFIFTQTKIDAKNVYMALQEEGYSVGTLSSDYDVEERKEALQSFRTGAIRYLVATNVTARGIDISNVCMVVNYSLPYNPLTRTVDSEAYLHRIGRCGRFGKQGLALSFADRSNSEDYIRDLVNIFAKPIDELSIVDGELSAESQIAITS